MFETDNFAEIDTFAENLRLIDELKVSGIAGDPEENNYNFHKEVSSLNDWKVSTRKRLRIADLL